MSNGLIGTGAGMALGGPVGAMIGAQVGFGMDALGKSSDAADAAYTRLIQAQNEYNTGMNRAQDWEQGQDKGISDQQWAANLKGATAAPTGAQATKTLEGGYATALQGSKDAGQAAGPAPKAASPLADVFSKDIGARTNAALSPSAHSMALQDVQQTAQMASQQFKLDSARLNRQLAEISNVAGVEKAQLAARYAAATGQYPLDLKQAEQAGAQDAAISGLAGGLASGSFDLMGSAYKAGQYNKMYNNKSSNSGYPAGDYNTPQSNGQV